MATLSTSFSTTSSSPAILLPGKLSPLTISYSKLASDISSFQSKLSALGISHKSAVSIALPNSYPFAVSFLATCSQRAIAAPLNSAYKQSEFEFYIDDLSSALCLIPQGSYAKNEPAVHAARKFKAAIAECYYDSGKGEVILDVKERGKLAGASDAGKQTAQPDDIALVLHTSGTTGRPKAVPLTHRNLTKTMRNIKDTYDLSPRDRTLLVMPLFHVHGLLAGFLAPLHSGGSVIVPGAFSASTFWENFVGFGANWYTAVPTIHQILLKNPPREVPEIRFIRSCSSPLAPKTFHELEKVFKAPVLEAYAMTEAAHQMTSNPLPSRGKRYPGSVGVGQGVEVAILDQEGKKVRQGGEGEICIRGENVTPGYLNNEKANRESFTGDGFFRTGDQGKLDEQGYVYITGRIKELINKGGEKISPIEVDNVVSSHPGVAEAVAFAVEDEKYGQDVGVAVVSKDSREGRDLSVESLRSFVAEKVAKFNVPSKVYFTDVMPKTATGKIQRRMIAAEMVKRDEKKSKL